MLYSFLFVLWLYKIVFITNLQFPVHVLFPIVSSWPASYSLKFLHFSLSCCYFLFYLDNAFLKPIPAMSWQWLTIFLAIEKKENNNNNIKYFYVFSFSFFSFISHCSVFPFSIAIENENSNLELNVYKFHLLNSWVHFYLFLLYQLCYKDIFSIWFAIFRHL